MHEFVHRVGSSWPSTNRRIRAGPVRRRRQEVAQQTWSNWGPRVIGLWAPPPNRIGGPDQGWDSQGERPQANWAATQSLILGWG